MSIGRFGLSGFVGYGIHGLLAKVLEHMKGGHSSKTPDGSEVTGKQVSRGKLNVCQMSLGGYGSCDWERVCADIDPNHICKRRNALSENQG